MWLADIQWGPLGTILEERQKLQSKVTILRACNGSVVFCSPVWTSLVQTYVFRVYQNLLEKSKLVIQENKT